MDRFFEAFGPEQFHRAMSEPLPLDNIPSFDCRMLLVERIEFPGCSLFLFEEFLECVPVRP